MYENDPNPADMAVVVYWHGRAGWYTLSYPYENGEGGLNIHYKTVACNEYVWIIPGTVTADD